MSDRPDTRRLFLVVVAEIFLYVVLDAIVQSLPPHYSPIRDAESDLAVGPYGYIMTINFLNRGVLSLVFIYALLRTIRETGGLGASGTGRRFPRGTFVFGVWAVGAILLAMFPTDVPATPVSWHGAIHLVVAILAFVGGAFGALMLSWQFGENPALKRVKPVAVALGGFAVVTLFIQLGLPFVAAHAATRVGGLTERVFLGSVLLWIAAVAAYLGFSPKVRPTPSKS